MKGFKALRAKPLEALFHRTILTIYVLIGRNGLFSGCGGTFHGFMSAGTPGTVCADGAQKMWGNRGDRGTPRRQSQCQPGPCCRLHESSRGVSRLLHIRYSAIGRPGHFRGLDPDHRRHRCYRFEYDIRHRRPYHDAGLKPEERVHLRFLGQWRFVSIASPNSKSPPRLRCPNLRRSVCSRRDLPGYGSFAGAMLRVN